MTNETKHPARPSNLTRAHLCPPSIWRERDAPKMIGPEAAEGRLLHSMIAFALRVDSSADVQLSHAMEQLTANQRGIVWSCVRFAEAKLAEISAEVGFRADNIEIEENIHVTFLGSHIISGTPDYAAYWQLEDGAFRILLIDWKTGYKVAPVPVSRDMQFWPYAKGVQEYCDSQDVVVDAYRFCPRLWDQNRIDSAQFSNRDNPDQWDKFAEAIAKIVNLSKPDAKASPGAIQCDDCGARFSCQDCAVWHAEPKPAQGIRVENMGAAVVEELLLIVEGKAKAKLEIKRIEAAEKMLLAMMAAGQEIEGYHSKPKREEARIINNEQAANALQVKLGLPMLAFLNSTKPSLRKLAAAHRANKMGDGEKRTFKLAREEVEEALGEELLVYESSGENLVREET